MTETGPCCLRRDLLDNWTKLELSLLALEMGLSLITPAGDNHGPSNLGSLTSRASMATSVNAVHRYN